MHLLESLNQPLPIFDLDIVSSVDDAALAVKCPGTRAETLECSAVHLQELHVFIRGLFIQ
jgi:hypothetical protein